jgi:vesicle coat complex subunit
MGIGLGLAFLILDAFLIFRWRVRKSLKNYEVWKMLVAAEIKAFNAKSKDELREVISTLLELVPLVGKNHENQSYSMQICYYCKGRLEGSPNG